MTRIDLYEVNARQLDTLMESEGGRKEIRKAIEAYLHSYLVNRPQHLLDGYYKYIDNVFSEDCSIYDCRYYDDIKAIFFDVVNNINVEEYLPEAKPFHKWEHFYGHNGEMYSQVPDLERIQKLELMFSFTNGRAESDFYHYSGSVYKDNDKYYLLYKTCVPALCSLGYVLQQYFEEITQSEVNEICKEFKVINK